MTLALAMASSHAFAVEDPAGWDEKRERNRRNFAARYGFAPPDHPRVEAETDGDVARRHGRIREAHAHLRHRLCEHKPDCLVIVADDQDEVFADGNFPQLAVFLGEGFTAPGVVRSGPRHARRAEPDLARRILDGAVSAGVDMACLTTLPDGFLSAHAVGPLLEVVDPAGDVPVVPVFVNAIHPPAPSPSRAYEVGRVLAGVLARRPGRSAMLASGGLSHFPASFPPGHHPEDPPFPWGAIDEKFDRWFVERIAAGMGSDLAALSSADLLVHGEAELLCWIVLLGAIGDAIPELVEYQPFYRAITGFGVACWDLEEAV